MTHIINFLLALALAVAFFGLLYIVAEPVESGETRLQHAAKAICTDALGPGVRVLRTREGDLVCRPATVTAGAE